MSTQLKTKTMGKNARDSNKLIQIEINLMCHHQFMLFIKANKQI